MMFSNKDLKRLIIPLLIEQLLAMTIGIADTVMVTSVGEAAVSGISLVDSINILLINIFSALATGGAVVAAQFFGRRDEDGACKAAKQLLYSITALSMVIAMVTMIFRGPLLHSIFGDIQPEVMEAAQTYFFLSLLSYPFLAIYNAGAALCRSMGKSKTSMYTSGIMNLVNISGNALLIFGFGMGVAGAGIASLVSRMLGGAIMIGLLVQHHYPIRFKRILKPELDFTMIKHILNIGVPNGLENGMFQVGKILVQSLIASFGTAAIAGNAVANSVAALEILPGSAIGLSMITVVGQCVGAGDYTQARQYTKKLMKVACLSMLALNLVLLLLTRPIVGIFGLTAETAKIASELLYYHGICAILIWPISFTLPNALRAASDVRFTMITSIISMWTFRIAFSYILGSWMGMGVLGVWVAMTIDWVFRSVVFLIRFKGKRWETKAIVYSHKAPASD